MLKSLFAGPLVCAVVLLGTVLAVPGTADVAPNSVTGAPPSTDIMLTQQAVANLPAPDFLLLAERDMAATEAASLSLDPDAFAQPSSSGYGRPERLVMPILAVVLIGGAWLLYNSQFYTELYDSLFGPLTPY